MQKNGNAERHCMFEKGTSRAQGSPEGGQLLCFWTPFVLTVTDAATISALLLQFTSSMQSWSEVPQFRLFKLGKRGEMTSLLLFCQLLLLSGSLLLDCPRKLAFRPARGALGSFPCHSPGTSQSSGDHCYILMLSL